MVILRTDAGEELGRFKNVREAREYASRVDANLSLVITARDGVVLARRLI